MKRELLRSLIVTIVIVTMNGCGDIGSSENSDSNSDKLKITQSENDFNLVWNKNYNGYSEVVFMKEITEEERGDVILSNNYTGKHTLSCNLSSNSLDSVLYSCKGLSPDLFGGKMDISKSLHFKKGIEYKILMNSNALDLKHSSVKYIVEFNGNTLTIH